jgi:hypothetical protein
VRPQRVTAMDTRAIVHLLDNLIDIEVRRARVDAIVTFDIVTL